MTAPEPEEPVIESVDDGTVTAGIHGPDTLLQAVPRLLGYYPEQGDILAIVAGHDHHVAGLMRYKAEEEATPRDLGTMVARGVTSLANFDAASLIVVAYGPEDRMLPYLAAAAGGWDSLRAGLVDLIRVEDGRYWSLRDPEQDPDGIPFSVDDGLLAAELTFHGVNPARTREEMKARLRTAEMAGNIGIVTEAASIIADRVVADIEHGDDIETAGLESHKKMIALGIEVGERVIDATLNDIDPDQLDMAILAMLLSVNPVRDHMWALMTMPLAGDYTEMWLKVLSVTQEANCAPVACMLAWCAWQDGSGVVAQFALELAAVADREYRMGHALYRAMTEGLPPTDPPATVEEVDQWHRYLLGAADE